MTPIAIFATMIWLVLFGIFGKLEFGYFLLIPSLAIWALLLRLRCPEFFKIDELKSLLSIPSLLYILFLLWSFNHSDGIKFLQWDEFSHWGADVKSMFLFNVLGPESPVSFEHQYYPPGLSVLGYAVMKLSGTWDESKLFWTHEIIFFSIIFAAASKFNYRRIFYPIISLTILLLSSITFFNHFQTVYADPLLALVFGYSAYFAFNLKYERRKSQYVYLAIILTSLFLIKVIGLILGLVSLLLLIVNLLFSLERNKLGKRNYIFYSVFPSLSILLFVFFSQKTWYWYFCSKQPFNSQCTSSPFNLSSWLNSEHYGASIQTYLELINSRQITFWNGVEINTIQWIIIVLLIFILVGASSRQGKHKKIALSASLILGAAIYFVALYLAYISTIFAGTGKDFPSFERYSATYIAGVFFLAALISNDELADSSKSDRTNRILLMPKISLAMIFIVLFVSPQGYLVEFFEAPSRFSVNIRSQFETIEKKIELSKFTEHDKIYVITQHKMGYEFYFLQYSAIPGNTPTAPFSIGSKYGPDDYWTNEGITLDKWNEELKNYDYVILYNISESFRQEFYSIFDDPEGIEEQTIYFVEHRNIGNKLVKFI